MTQDLTGAATPAPITRFRSKGFFVADYATVENGKISAIGAYWAVLRFPTFPALLPAMALVAVIEIPFHANQADHLLRMGLEDADGVAQSFKVEGAFRTAPRIEAAYGEPGTVPIAVPVHGLTIERPGKYSFTLTVDNEPLDRCHFTAIQIAKIASPQLSASPPEE